MLNAPIDKSLIADIVHHHHGDVSYLRECLRVRMRGRKSVRIQKWFSLRSAEKTAVSRRLTKNSCRLIPSHARSVSAVELTDPH